MASQLPMSLTRDPGALPQELLHEYELVGQNLIGNGAFAIVRKLRRKSTGEFVALKIVEKQPLKIRNMVKQMQRELRIQQQLDHPNILKLLRNLEDESYVYMVLEFCSKGQLLNVIMSQPEKRLTEPQAAFYFEQVLRGVEFMHQNSCVHRDLKLENMLITEDNVLKICDFGWSAEVEMEKMLQTTCGTTAYWAPEIWESAGQSEPVDLWSLGCMLYEMLAGHPPFWGSDKETMKAKVLSCQYSFPPWISNEGCHLIHCLLQRDPKHRVRCSDLINHKWLQMHKGKEPPAPASVIAEVESSKMAERRTSRPSLTPMPGVTLSHPSSVTQMKGVEEAEIVKVPIAIAPPRPTVAGAQSVQVAERRPSRPSLTPAPVALSHPSVTPPPQPGSVTPPRPMAVAGVGSAQAGFSPTPGRAVPMTLMPAVANGRQSSDVPVPVAARPTPQPVNVSHMVHHAPSVAAYNPIAGQNRHSVAAPMNTPGASAAVLRPGARVQSASTAYHR